MSKSLSFLNHTVLSHIVPHVSAISSPTPQLFHYHSRERDTISREGMLLSPRGYHCQEIRGIIHGICCQWNESSVRSKKHTEHQWWLQSLKNLTGREKKAFNIITYAYWKPTLGVFAFLFLVRKTTKNYATKFLYSWDGKTFLGKKKNPYFVARIPFCLKCAYFLLCFCQLTYCHWTVQMWQLDLKR